MNPVAILNAERRRTQLSPDKEKAFQKWYKVKAKQSGMDPNPDNPRHAYDMRGAYLAGEDMKLSKEDNKYHWSSKYKDEDHPNRYVKGIDTITGKKATFNKVKIKELVLEKEKPNSRVKSDLLKQGYLLK